MSRRNQSVSSSSVGSGDSGFSSNAGYSASSTGSSYSVATQYTTYAEEGPYDQNQYQLPELVPYALPCEFVGIGSCDVHFNFEDIEPWIEHIIRDHLQDKLPQKTVCWFCNDFYFDAKDPQANNDRRLNFHNRMEHIREHIADGKTANDIAPDYHMLDHLFKYRLISEGRYNEVRRWHGLPCPREHMKGIYKHGFVPPEKQRQAERSNMVQIDHDKEERQRRKGKKDKKKR
ncbi:uncharacterized protein F4807DRAFT_66895 [Annulohypoxylon truncatum]|uniref:uncharacterized protein n=1 Tax=Annulohypoxylon truncatum TaxID=327061 RepID=UPI002007DD2B|nr:uncharacterized protein F4807DRAFT_66895 [Annulohypoxylon truncatum]KAI1210450.1 hypothetical protein F4807DRAFT_66895 [Annulohypoxylon truncatum]